MIVTIRDLMEELSAEDQMLKVLVFDGAESFPIELLRVTHSSHEQPHIYVTKLHPTEDAHGRLIGQLHTQEREIAELIAKIDKARKKLRQAFECRDTLKGILAGVEERRK